MTTMTVGSGYRDDDRDRDDRGRFVSSRNDDYDDRRRSGYRDEIVTAMNVAGS